LWHPDLADNIHRLRRQLGLTQERVADLAGISIKTYQRIERGEVSPRVQTLLLIARALRTTGEALMRRVTLDPAEADDAPAPGLGS
jgi:transcriptional regulator with XRE-family HTH domain